MNDHKKQPVHLVLLHSNDIHGDFAGSSKEGLLTGGLSLLSGLLRRIRQEERSCFTDMAEEYGAEQVIYAHCHGETRFHDSIMGEYRGVRYSLVSGDYLRWHPMTVLD